MFVAGAPQSRSGYCSAVDVLAVTDAFVNEDNFTVWRDLSASLASVAVIMQYTDAYPEFKQFCCQLFGKICAALGWDAQDGEGELVGVGGLCERFLSVVLELRCVWVV